MALTWTTQLSVGNETIDTQHKKLISIINDLLSAMSKAQGHDVIEGTLASLDEYVVEHFSYEEKFMKENNYPEFTNHLGIHDKFRTYLSEFKNDFEQKGSTLELVLKVQRFIGEWLIQHIGTEDLKYATYIKEKHQTPNASGV